MSTVDKPSSTGIEREAGTRKLGYTPALDGLRAIAVGMVMLYHLGPNVCPGGWLGVDVFFVLSGFLITTLLAEEQAATGIDYVRFIGRRLFRLYPALIALLIGATIYAEIKGLPNWGRIASYTIEVRRNIVDMHQVQHVVPNDGIGPTWSLAMEDQFYLIWPLILIVASKFLSRRGLAGLAATGAVASLIDKVVLYEHGATADRLFFGPDCCADLLLIGCVAGLLFANHDLDKLNGGRLARWAPPVVILILAVSFAGVHKSRAIYVGPTTILALAAAALIVGLVVAPEGWTARLLTWFPLVLIGRWSYSLYLWHTLAYMIAPPGGNVGKVVLAFVFGICSFYLVEQPIRKIGRVVMAK